MRRLFMLATLILVVLVASACSATQSASPAASGAAFSGGGTASAPANDSAKGQSGAAAPGQAIGSFANAGRSLILTANVSFRSADPWGTADKVRAIAAGLGGDLLAMSQTGSGDQRSALVTIRVPSDRFDDALSQVKKLDGEVLTSGVTAQDVTDQFVDVQARLDAQKAQEQQYLTILAKATTVDEILKVQSALASTRTQIEQLQAQVNSMKGRIDYATITMNITPLVTIPGTPTGQWDPSRTFAQAVAALSALFRVVGDAAIWILVFGWIPLIVLAVAFMATRTRRMAPAA